MQISPISLYPYKSNNDNGKIAFGTRKMPRDFRKVAQKEIEDTVNIINSKVHEKASSISDENTTKVYKTIAQKSFRDIGGYNDIIEILQQDIIYPIRYPEAFSNSKLSHGTMLFGQSGTGKTTLAEAVAKEADAYFIKVDGMELSDKWA